MSASPTLTTRGAQTNALAEQARRVADAGLDASVEFAELWDAVYPLLMKEVRHIVYQYRQRGMFAAEDDLSQALREYAYEQLLSWDPNKGSFSTWLQSSVRKVVEAVVLPELRPGDTKYYYEVLLACRKVPNYRELDAEDLANASGYPVTTIEAALSWQPPTSFDRLLDEEGRRLEERLPDPDSFIELPPEEIFTAWYDSLESGLDRYDAFCMLYLDDDPEIDLSARKYGESHTILGRHRSTENRKRLADSLAAFARRAGHIPGKHD